MDRQEHPKPQFERAEWLNLNGQWEFEIDNGRSGIARKLWDAPEYSYKINVPFCPQSKLSGLEFKDFTYGVWYRRKAEITKKQLSGIVNLHFGAVDYKTYVYINGELAGEHKGGYVSFKFDITKYLKEGENTIVVYAEDDERDPMIPRGKQSERFYSHSCDYTRTTGIWQTVWLEFLPKTHVEKVKYYPDVDNCRLHMSANLAGAGKLCVTAKYEGRQVGYAEAESKGGLVYLDIDLAEKQLWEPGCGRLYDLEISYGEDFIKSYFGLRSVKIDGFKFKLNDKTVFQRTILDQGFYPDGIYTAPSDAELLADVKRCMALGFNGARLHEKVFEERFLYHAAKEGYLVWGEYPNWGLDHSRPEAVYSILFDFLDEVERDFNQPAIIGWCPFNETWDQHGCRQCDNVLYAVYRAVKAADDTRVVIDTSGAFHTQTDIYDIHDYNQNFEEFKKTYDDYLLNGGKTPHQVTFDDRQDYHFDRPFFVSEYGGIKWSKQTENAWGYGNAPQSEEEFITRFKGLADAMLDNPMIMGFCYTQLTDVEQEQNGLYTYDRKCKFPPEIMAPIISRKAAIED